MSLFRDLNSYGTGVNDWFRKLANRLFDIRAEPLNCLPGTSTVIFFGVIDYHKWKYALWSFYIKCCQENVLLNFNLIIVKNLCCLPDFFWKLKLFLFYDHFSK